MSHRLLVIVLLVSLSIPKVNSAQDSTRWMPVGGDVTELTLLDTRTLERFPPDSARLWVWVRLAKPDTASKLIGETPVREARYSFDQFRASYTIYCVSKRYLRRTLIRYSGSTVQADIDFTQFPAAFPSEEIAPESVMEALLNSVCRPG